MQGCGGRAHLSIAALAAEYLVGTLECEGTDPGPTVGTQRLRRQGQISDLLSWLGPKLRHPAAACGAARTEQPWPAPRHPSPHANAVSCIAAERVSHLMPAQALGEAFPRPGKVSAWLYRCAKTYEGSSVPVCSPEHLLRRDLPWLCSPTFQPLPAAEQSRIGPRAQTLCPTKGPGCSRALDG